MILDRKHVIAAGFAVFVAWAHLSEWLPALRWIPHAFIAGILAAVLGFLYLLTSSRGIHYREYGATDHAPRAQLAFTQPAVWEEEKAALRSREEYRRPLIFPEAILFSKAVDGLLDLIIRDNVTSWYRSISTRPLFQHEIDRCIRSVLLSVAARLTNYDLVEIGMARILPIVTGHMKDFYDAERIVRGKDLMQNVTESPELDLAIASKYNGGKLHSVAFLVNADTTIAQQEHFRSLVAKLLPIVLPDNMKSSRAVTVLVREIVACAVISPVMQMLVDPDTWNQLIVTLGGPMLQDRKAVRKMRAALDQNAPASPKAVRQGQLPRLRPYDSERQFERFIRAIRLVSTLAEARKLRSELLSQLRRDSAVPNQDAAYLRRLETGKRLLDQKIAVLSAQSDSKPKLSVQPPVVGAQVASDDVATIRAPRDRHPASALSPDSPSSRETSPLSTRRPQLAITNRAPELRRAVLSSTNLRDSDRQASANPPSRRSLDDSAVKSPRKALFADDLDDDNMTSSITSLQSYESDGETARKAHVESVMKSALDDIVGEEDKDSLFSDSNGRPSLETLDSRQSVDSARPALPARPVTELKRPALSTRASEKAKPSISSLGLVGGPANHGVFVDDLFADEAQKFAEDEKEEFEATDKTDEDEVQEAAPGDLGLTEAIDALNADIEKLTAQRQIVDSLTAKAELTNNVAELRILKKSEQSLEREIKRKEMQRQQYSVQEGDNSLFGRAAVSIKSVMIGREPESGHEYALYVIEVRRQAGEQMSAATWAITRRYSQFHELHKRLRARFPSVRELDFPRRQALFTLQRDVVEKRRVVLERYLRSLLLAPSICRSREFRAFLSQSAIISNGHEGTQVDPKDFVTRIYNSVSDGMEEFLGNIPVLDQLSVAGQNLISAATTQLNGSTGSQAVVDRHDPAVQNPETSAEAEAELNAYETKEAEPFVKPICDLFLETFELSKGNSWLRGRTVVVVLHQLLGSTIERRVRDAIKTATEDESLAKYVALLRDTMWPDGKPRPSSVPRTEAEKARSRKEAALILGALIPDLAGSVVGKTNAVAASRKIVAAVNNQRLNTHIIFTLIDEVISIIFPETASK